MSVKRRDFITLLSGAAAGWPLAARAQQADRVRRIGVFMGAPPDDPISQTRSAVLLRRLQELGWTVGRNIQIEWRWYAANVERARKDAQELVALAPDVIVGVSGPPLKALVEATRTVPVVFSNVVDPVAGGFVESLARPGGNVTGFASIDYSVNEKLLQLLKEIAPGVTRALVLRTPAPLGNGGQFDALRAVAPAMGIELQPLDPSEPSEIKRAIDEFTKAPNGGLVVTASAPAALNRKLIVAQAASHRLPAVYSNREFPIVGGLISYGSVRDDLIRGAAEYVDRILRGAKPADLPVQAPTKFEMVVNLKTAKALGLDISPALLSVADEVIE